MRSCSPAGWLIPHNLPPTERDHALIAHGLVVANGQPFSDLATRPAVGRGPTSTHHAIVLGDRHDRSALVERLQARAPALGEQPGRSLGGRALRAAASTDLCLKIRCCRTVLAHTVNRLDGADCEGIKEQCSHWEIELSVCGATPRVRSSLAPSTREGSWLDARAAMGLFSRRRCTAIGPASTIRSRSP